MSHLGTSPKPRELYQKSESSVKEYAENNELNLFRFAAAFRSTEIRAETGQYKVGKNKRGKRRGGERIEFPRNKRERARKNVMEIERMS